MLKELVAGDSLSFYTTVPAFPPGAGWVLHYRLVPQNAAQQVIELAAADAGEQHRALCIGHRHRELAGPVSIPGRRG
jgi:hypothetical protein